MICLIKYFCWKKRVVSLWLFRLTQAYNHRTKVVKLGIGRANGALLICARQLYSFFVFLIPVDWNHPKSIKISHNQTELISYDKKLCDQLLSISNICRLISIDNDRQPSNCVNYWNYRPIGIIVLLELSSCIYSKLLCTIINHSCLYASDYTRRWFKQRDMDSNR